MSLICLAYLDALSTYREIGRGSNVKRTNPTSGRGGDDKLEPRAFLLGATTKA